MEVDTTWIIYRYIDPHGNYIREETLWPGSMVYKDVVEFDTLGNQVAKFFVKKDSIIRSSFQKVAYKKEKPYKVEFYKDSSTLLAISKVYHENKVEIDSQWVLPDSISFVTIHNYDQKNRLKSTTKYREDEIIQEDVYGFNCGLRGYVMTHSSDGENLNRFKSEQKFNLDTETNLISSQEMKSWEYTDSSVEESCATWVYHYDYYEQ